ncbi:hypothetical protein BH11VER1_BH11VER1_28740 [soil metagenome]
MKCLLFLFCAWLLGLVATDCAGQAVSGALPSAPPQSGISTVTLAPKVASSTSANKQFTVHGADLTARSTFIMLCEESATILGKLLKDDGRFLLPVVVVLKTPPDISLNGPAVTTSISELSYGGFHFQMTVQLRNDFRTEDFTLELVRVLLAERILRNHQSLQTTRQRVLPDWLLTGVSEAMEFRSRARPSLLFSAVFKSGQVYSIDRIIDADPAQLDAMARGIYEASSCALVLTLLEQPDGPVRFTKFLDALAQDNQSDRDLLKKHFPTLGISKNSLEKWWTLQMATLATPSALETLSVTETEALLDKALLLQVENYVEPAVAAPKPETAKAPSLFHKTPAKEKVEESPPVPDEKSQRNADKAAKPKPEPVKPEPVKEAPKPANKKKAAAEPATAPAKVAAKETPQEKEPESPKPTIKKKAIKEPAAPVKEEPKQNPKENETAKPKTAATGDLDLWLNALGLVNPFTGGREIAFPFRKTPKPSEEDPKKEEEKKEKPAEKKPEAKPAPEKKAVKPEKTEPAKVPEAVPGLPAKSAATRSVSGKPDDLPATKEEPKKEEPKPVEAPEGPDKKAGGFNPLGWFRKNTPNEKAEPLKEEAKPIQRASSKPTVAESLKTDFTEIPVDDYQKIWKRPDRSEILRRNMEQLNALKVRAHPLYKDVIGAYSAALQKLVNGTEKGMPDTFDVLHKKRDAIHETAKAVESHLDWFEASGTVHYSGTFNDYFKLRDELDKQIRPRSDALSQYLDAIEKEYEE